VVADGFIFISCQLPQKEGDDMVSKLVCHIGDVKISRRKNAKGDVFFRIPYVTPTFSKMTQSDYYGISKRRFETANKYREAKMHQKAMEYYKKALEADSNNETAILHLAALHADLGKYAESAQYYFRLIELGTKWKTGAEKTPARIHTVNSIIAEGHEGLGKLFAKMGSRDIAISHLEKSLEFMPGINHQLSLANLMMGLYTEVGNKEAADRIKAVLYLVD